MILHNMAIIIMAPRAILQYRCFSEKEWGSWVNMGNVVGSVKKPKEITSFQIAYTGIGMVHMQAYLQSKGWTSTVKNGETCGDEEGNNSIQAIRLQLDDAPGYHIFYRVFTSQGQWSLWKRDFEVAGTPDVGLAIAAIEIRLTMDEPHLQYRVHMQNIGWTKFVGENQVAGLEGKGLRMEALFVHYGGPGRIILQGHCENKGWLPEVSSDMICGTEGLALRLEAVRIRLVDVEGFHIYYRGYVKGFGWQGWVKDGEDAGTEGKCLPLEALQIRISM